MHPLWYHLLYEQQYGQGITSIGPTGKPQVGLTPPFLLGAIHDAAVGRNELLALLESMRDNSTGRLVHIAECDIIHQPRASLTDGAMGHLGEAVLSSDGSKSHLYASPHYFAVASREVESLTNGLWAILGSPISNGQFTYRDADWRSYEPYERDFIKRAKKNQADA